MNHSTWQMIADTPWWVYAGALYTVYIGYCATKPRTVAATTILTIPTTLIFLSIVSLSYFVQFNLLNVVVWLCALVIGSLLGWWQFHHAKVKAVKNKLQLHLPGSWSVLIMIWAICAMHYFYTDAFSMTPETLSATLHPFPTLLLYGFFSGLFAGRAAYSWRCLHYGPYV